MLSCDQISDGFFVRGRPTEDNLNDPSWHSVSWGFTNTRNYKISFNLLFVNFNALLYDSVLLQALQICYFSNFYLSFLLLFKILIIIIVYLNIVLLNEVSDCVLKLVIKVLGDELLSCADDCDILVLVLLHNLPCKDDI